MFDENITRQYVKFIIQSGYKYTKDNLGFYFDSGNKKFSIMKTGPLFQCYYNENVDGQWVLKQKSNSIFEFSQGLKWILNIIQNSK